MNRHDNEPHHAQVPATSRQRGLGWHVEASQKLKVPYPSAT